jgi:hypothetical protein
MNNDDHLNVAKAIRQEHIKEIQRLIPARMDIETLLKENDEYSFNIPKDKLEYFLKGINFALIKVKGIVEDQLE